jgi:hypothetical protein
MKTVGLPLPSGFTDDRILTDLTIPDTVKFRGKTCRVTAIGEGAFAGCGDLKGKLTLPAGLTEIGGGAFRGSSRLRGELTFPAGLTRIGDEAFADCSGLTVVTFALGEQILPDSYTFIGEKVFYGCSGLTSLILSGVIAIGGKQAFDGCTSLMSVVILSVMPPFGKNVFHDAPLDCNFTCPDGALARYQSKEVWVPYFGHEGTLVVKGLKFQIVGGRGDGYTTTFVGFARGEMPVLTIPDTVDIDGFSYPVTKIGDEAFEGCRGLTSVTFLSEKPPVAYNCPSVFSGVYCKIFCPEKSLDAYRVALRDMGLPADCDILANTEGAQKVRV